MTDLVEFVEQVVDMTPWQRRLLEQVGNVGDLKAALDHSTWQLAISGKRESKRLAMALAVVEALESGEHVHVVEPTGTICINGTCEGLSA